MAHGCFADLQLAAEVGVGRIADVGDHALHVPGNGLAAAAGADLETAVGAGGLDRFDDGLRVKFDVAVGPRGQVVGAHGNMVAVAQGVVGRAPDGLRAGAAGQPYHPRRRVLFRQGRQRAHRRRRGVPGPDDQSCFIGIGVFPFAGHVFQAVGDVRPGGRLAEGGDAAVAQPARVAVDAGAVQYHVGLLDALLALVVADQQAERFLGAAGVAGVVLLEQAAAAHVQDGRVLPNGRRQRRRQRQRLQIGADVFTAGDDGVGFGQRVLGLVRLDARPAQRRRVHAERAEKPDMAPASEMFADAAALIDGKGQLQRRGV